MTGKNLIMQDEELADILLQRAVDSLELLNYVRNMLFINTLI